MESKKSDIMQKSINSLFKIEKSTYIIAGVLIIGFILRMLAGLRNKFSGDEMVHGVHAIGFIASGKLQIMDQSAIWFWLTDFFMKIFSVNVLGIRFASILFGSMSLVVIYLIGKEVFNKRAGIIASIIALVSSYQISTTEAGMDTTMTFFILVSVYFFTLSIKTSKNKFFFLSWAAIGIAVMTKPIALLFATALFLCSVYYDFKSKRKKSLKTNLKKYALVIILLVIMFLPVLTFNYLLYKDKGILDLQFARFTRISVDTYASISPTIERFSLKTLFSEYSPGTERSGLAEAASYLYKYEFSDSFIVLLFSLIGLFYLFKDKNKFAPLLIFTFGLPFMFLAGTSILPNHFLFASIYISLFAGYGLDRPISIMKSQKYVKVLLVIILLVVTVHSFMKISENKGNGLFGQKEAMSLVIDFKESEIDKNSLVITDGRIYKGRSVFMFWDRNYLEGTTFLETVKNANTIPGEETPVEVYYLECVPEDCGWGYIDEQPELNQSMESLSSSFSSGASLVKTVNDVYGKPYFKIYKTKILLKSGVFDIAEINREWFYYPINYKPKSKIFDNYEVRNPLDKTLNILAHLVLYIEILTAMLLAFAIIYILIRDK